MPRIAFLALTLPAFLTAACVAVPPAERAATCRATDWYGAGRNDGRLGNPPANRAAQFADCTGLGYPADRGAYRAGYADGLRDYCTAANGYREGYAGRRYRNVCPPHLEARFLQGYAQGRSERPVAIVPYFDWDTDIYDDGHSDRRDRDRHNGDRHNGDRHNGDGDHGDRDKGDGDWHDRNKDRGDHDWRDRDQGDRDKGDHDWGDRDGGSRNWDDRDSNDRDSGSQDWGDRDSGDHDSGNRDDGGDRDWDTRDSDDHRDNSDDDDDEIRHQGTEA